MELIEQRARTHGDFALTAEWATKLQDMTSARIDEPPVMRHAREMICVKLARIASGDPMHADHWRDIAGYAALVAEMLKPVRRGASPQEQAECGCVDPTGCAKTGCQFRG